MNGNSPSTGNDVDIQKIAFTPRRTVGTQAILLAGATGAAQVATAGMYILAARLVSPEEFGPIASVIATATAVVGFVDFGTNSLWVRDIARGALSATRLGRKVLAKLALSLSAATFWCVLVLTIWPAEQYWVIAPVAFAMLTNQTSQVPLRGIGRADLAALAVISDRMCGAIVMVTLILLGVSPPTALWISIMLGSFVAALTAWRLAPSRSLMVFSKRWWTNPWAGAGFYGVSNLANSAQSLDLAVMSAFGGPAVAGVYGAVNRWTQPLGLLVGAFSSASVPFVARADSWKDAWNHVRSAIWLPLVAILLCVAAFFLSPILVTVLIGTSYSGSVPVLQLLALATIPGIINQPLAGFLQAVRLDRAVAVVMTSNVIIVLGLIAALSSAFGAVGAAMAALVTQTLVALAFAAIAISAMRDTGNAS
ncbi:MAG TPA: oligosaccharide flippase family protein [Bryobacteraceae bacterium]